MVRIFFNSRDQTSIWDQGSPVLYLIRKTILKVCYRHRYHSSIMDNQGTAFIHYNGDMNNDGTTNDMIYIPAKQSDINLITIPASGSNPAITPDQQWANLDAFISHDKYLNSHRGQYAQRNAARSPFQNEFDLQLLQEFKVKAGTSVNRLQVTFAILNIGNMLNKKWGHSIYASNQQFNLINYKGVVGSLLLSHTMVRVRLMVTPICYLTCFPLERPDGLRYIFN